MRASQKLVKLPLNSLHINPLHFDSIYISLLVEEPPLVYEMVVTLLIMYLSNQPIPEDLVKLAFLPQILNLSVQP